ncbi:deacetylase SIR2 [Mycoplasmopsis agalactiae]|uniref:Deacetylase sirtuin-type domain-containing protein n=1 Tax=Mycoplasmopsis agalactiae (strain NCTC 10123 / CIP 59.7 / PG2) TaxID=347257 RepID=A5IXE6_MYCAP|nr:deacetylase SIR2 [Mycoplasmopsis agalactiae]MCE6056818.1 deacetylase SIR2 [Mycoplasmopsis agalactiae]MCE6078606.1 deacetylase SIR2 [Mycoplasmopsis agalactiae]MCE6094991.1 deacetylase SIR2 [Mycoplasmopsis agalactiae]MCE6114249.1 deacetylase SIR2 [Mycoplasmopsis agalactiae]NLS34592.1 deacetylase SIR2 [Mycoplasmopsis agalactiae]
MLTLNSVKELDSLINEADAIVIGIGSGMTSADGIGYSGQRFVQNFKDFIDEFKFLDMLQASVYHFDDIQNYWAFHSRFMKLNYFDQPASESFLKLKEYLKGKNYHIITTNSDNSLEAADFEEDKIFYIQGKYNLLQCSKMCHNTLYSNDKAVYEMIEKQKDMKVPLGLIPRCPKCNNFLEVNKRLKGKGMVEDKRFFEEKKMYEDFIHRHKGQKILFWEIGVGFSTPTLIKFPFWEMTKEFSNSKYVAMNNKSYRTPQEIRQRTYVWTDDIKQTINKLLEVKNDFSRAN